VDAPPLAVPPRAIVTALMPYFFGTAERTWSTWQFNITSTYLGLVPVAALPLAALALAPPPTLFFAASPSPPGSCTTARSRAWRPRR